jgi:hypothetical protein
MRDILHVITSIVGGDARLFPDGSGLSSNHRLGCDLQRISKAHTRVTFATFRNSPN